jgi:hypothetical protein
MQKHRLRVSNEEVLRHHQRETRLALFSAVAGSESGNLSKHGIYLHVINQCRFKQLVYHLFIAAFVIK